MIKTNNLRQFHNKTFLIKKVYNPYRDGWLDNWTTKTHRTFKYFPFHDVEVLRGKTPEMEEVSAAFKNMKPGDKQELREQIWENGFPSFHKVKDKMDSDFFKTWKKVFDLEIETEQEVEVDAWDKETKSNVRRSDTEFNITCVSAGKIKSLLRGIMDEDKGETIPMIKGKDKAGNEAMVEAYDWEDSLKNIAEGKFVKVKVSGEGMDTKYMFQEGKEFKTTPESPATDEWADIPFK